MHSLPAVSWWQHVSLVRNQQLWDRASDPLQNKATADPPRRIDLFDISGVAPDVRYPHQMNMQEAPRCMLIFMQDIWGYFLSQEKSRIWSTKRRHVFHSREHWHLCNLTAQFTVLLFLESPADLSC